MDISQIQFYLIPAAFVGLVAWRFLRSRQVRKQLPALLSQGAIVVDVRSAAEYSSGARAGSINIPLAELESGANKLDHQKPVIVCCASGARSATAAALLKRKGFQNVVDAGPWTNTV